MSQRSARPFDRQVSRRDFVRGAVVAAPLLLMPQRLLARSTAPRALNFFHTHTSERLEVEYFDGGTYVPDALSTVNQFLRDFRTGAVHDIDPGLLDLLYGLADATGTRRPYEVISGYRSPVTNAMLRSHSEGVAAHSLHMVGQAIDIRLTDVPLARLREAALAARVGGVGFYPASNFVHVDTGRIRAW